MNDPKIIQASHDKKLFGVLQQFKNLIVFANDNGSNKNGAFIDADYNAMRNCVTRVMKENLALREFFKSCINDAYKADAGIVKPDIDFSQLKLR